MNIKHHSFEECQRWEDYDKQRHIGLMTLYQQQQQFTGPSASLNIINSKGHYTSSPKRHQTLPDYQQQYDENNNNLFDMHKKQKNICHYQNRKYSSRYKKMYLQHRERSFDKESPRTGSNCNKETFIDKVAVKIGHCNFGEMDNCPNISSSKQYKSLQTKIKRKNFCIKEELQKMVKNKHSGNHNFKGRYINKSCIAVQSERKEGKDSLQTIEKEENDRLNGKYKNVKLISERKITFMDYTVINLQNQHLKKSKQNKKNGKDINKFISRQRMISKEIDFKKRQALYRSNLLSTSAKIAPSLLEHRNIGVSDQSKLKQIIKLYFNSQYQKKHRSKS